MISWMVKVMLRLLGNGSLGCLVLVGIINKRAHAFLESAARRQPGASTFRCILGQWGYIVALARFPFPAFDRTESMAHDVFISHSAKDKATADAVCAMLESNGIRCWIAPRDVIPSMEWGEAIIDAIEQCRIMVLVFTANANESPQIRNATVAVTLAEQANRLTGGTQSFVLGTLAMAYAEAGRFEEARKSVQAAIQQNTGGGPEAVSDLEAQLKTYEAGQPWRESFAGPGPGAGKASQ